MKKRENNKMVDKERVKLGKEQLDELVKVAKCVNKSYIIAIDENFVHLTPQTWITTFVNSLGTEFGWLVIGKDAYIKGKVVVDGVEFVALFSA
jgi:hypothetical protein